MSSTTCLKMHKLKVMRHIPLSRRRLRFFLTLTDSLDDLKIQLNKYLVFRGEDHSTSHVFVQQLHYDLGAEKDEDMWNTVYYPKLIEDDSDVDFMFRRFC